MPFVITRAGSAKGCVTVKSFAIALFWTLAFVLPTGSVRAQKDPAVRLLEEQRDQARDAQLRRESAVSAPSTGRPALDSDPADVTESGPTIGNARMRVDAAGLLSSASVEATLAAFAELALGEQRLDLLLRRLDARLVEAGYVTSHATIVRATTEPPEVNIAIVPGRIEAIVADGTPASPAMARAFPARQGEVLTLPQVEQGLHQINRLRLYQAQINILPGSSPGNSVLDLVLSRGQPWHASFGADNQGSRATGRTRVRAGVGADDLFGQLESWQVLWLASAHSRASLATLALPQGFNTWSLTASASRSEQKVAGDFALHSTNWSVVAGLNRVLALSAEGRASADFTLTRTRAVREFERTSLTPDSLTVLRMAFNGVRNMPAAQWFAEPSISIGLPLLGARKDTDELTRRDAHAEFAKLGFAAGVVAQPAGPETQISGQATGQYSRVSLYGAEQFSLGGLGSVRGFPEGAIAGDSGYLLRSELRFTQLMPRLLAGQPMPYLHADCGAAWLAGAAREAIASAGIGVRWAGRGALLEAVAAAPIRQASTRHDDWQFHFSIAVEL